MRRLLPDVQEDVDLIGSYAPVQDERVFVRCNMISSVDGAIAVEGRSGMLGGPADHRVFETLRSLADVILVGAGTVRAEAYGPAVLPPALRASRQRRGQGSVPAIAVVTRSANMDWSSPFFTSAEERPLVLTTADGAEQAGARAGRVAEVVVAGEQWVEPDRAVEALAARGLRHVLCEGGPALNAQLVHAGVLDELCLTIAPRLVAGSGPRLLAGDELVPAVGLEILQLLEEDGFLFYRLRCQGA